MCEGLDEYDALPTVRLPVTEPVPERDEDDRDQRLNEQILAALVSP
jgi:hypothetical protein